MRSRKQSLLPGFIFKSAPLSHGGELSKGKRKTKRPIDPKQALHVVLRSSRARGPESMLHPKHCEPIAKLTEQLGARWGVRIYRYANVGNHIHLLVRVRSRESWKRFLRELCGGIALIVTGAKKGQPLKQNNGGRGFWDHLAFTRIVHFGLDFERVGRYLIKNLFEAAGVSMKILIAQGHRIRIVNQDGLISI